MGSFQTGGIIEAPKNLDNHLIAISPPEPVAIKCTDCDEYSQYKIEYNDKLPKGWRSDDKGNHCNKCRKK